MTQAQQNELRRPSHPWALYIGRLSGIPIYLHFTFFLLPAVIGIGEGFYAILFLLAVFACVVLHELGHATMARHYGIQTHDIILYPIGGVARLQSLGEGLQEFWIALAGPAVNLVIAFALWFALKLTGTWSPLGGLSDPNKDFGVWEFFAELRFMTNSNKVHPLQNLMFINIFLLLFNLIPAFPMDGGRVLRSLLGHWLPRERATNIAAAIGQLMAVGFIIYGMGVSHNFMLILIGFFIFSAAGQERLAVQTMNLISGRLARDAMISRFEVLQHGDTLGRAVEVLLQSNQHDFPVIGGSSVIGILSAKALLRGLASEGKDHYVAEIMNRNFPAIQAGDSLHYVLDLMRQTSGHPVLVFEKELLVGYINQDNLMEFLEIVKINPQNRH